MGKKTATNKYCTYSGYIEPCLLAYGCARRADLLVVLAVIYKLKLENIVYGNTLSLSWYDNASEF